MLTRVIISIVIGFIISFVIIIPLNSHRQFATILKNPTYIVNQKDQGITLYDRHGRSFFHFYEAKPKHIIPLSNIPPITQHAIIAIEDQTFYQHLGLSPRGIIRSLKANTQAGKIVYGGSTITQQVVKNTLLTPQKSWLRKYKEAFLALELELRYSKQQILEMYFNTAYFGEGAFGIEEAAQTYFQISAKDLNLAQSALLAGLLTQPSLLSPLSYDPNAAFNRQKIVLQNMAEQGYITLAEKEGALQEKLVFNPEPIARSAAAPHFALYVRDQLIQEFGEPYVIRSGLRVTTTLDLDIQAQAQEAITSQVAALKTRGAGNGAAVVIDPLSHEILAMVGSTSWYDPKWGKANMAISPRQTGSAFKPIVYAAAFEKQLITPATILLDIPTTFGANYRPQDYDGKSRGPVTVRRALANSLNVPAVAVMQKAGVTAVTQLAKALSITSLSQAQDHNLALALGAGEISLLELTNSYSTFAAVGNHLPAQAIISITDKQEQAVAMAKATPAQKVSPATAFLISSILSDNTARAEIFGRTLTISRPAAVKTGTSQNYRDAWTVGYTPQLAVGVWIGNNDNTPMQALAGALGAAPAWKNIMETTLTNHAILAFEPPQNIQKVTLCRRLNPTPQTGEETPPPTVARYQEYFLAGSSPKNRCGQYIEPQATPKAPEIVQNLTPISNDAVTLH